MSHKEERGSKFSLITFLVIVSLSLGAVGGILFTTYANDKTATTFRTECMQDMIASTKECRTKIRTARKAASGIPTRFNDLPRGDYYYAAGVASKGKAKMSPIGKKCSYLVRGIPREERHNSIVHVLSSDNHAAPWKYANEIIAQSSPQ
jgi:hypothetical protein